MYETAIHVLNFEIKRIDITIKNYKHRNTRLRTAINAMNNIKNKNQDINDSIKIYESDINNRNIMIEDWELWRKEVIEEIKILKSNG